MANLKIYNNGENKILFSAGDRIIKQPYEFGKAFQNRMGLNNYIKISGLNISSLTHSVGMWWNQNNPLSGYKYLINFRNSTQSASYQIRHLTSATDAWPFIRFHNQNNIQGFIWDIGKIRNSIFVKNGASYCRHWRNGVLTSEFASVLDNNPEWFADQILIGAYSNTIGGSLTYNNAAAKNNSLVIYDRAMTDSEIKYHVNNLIGSNLQTTVGLYIYLKLDEAEILNTGGSDFVGVRDYSGNNHHGRIMNLPAGTLQEQLDWANANLFVPFIS